MVDHASFTWHDSGWRGVLLPGWVLYECHVGTFSADGTFDGAIQHLQHLADLGVDIIELLPVAEFPGCRGWGYDGVDLFAPHHAYGGPEGLKRLVDAAHAQGIGVVMDVVYNHLGPDGNYLQEFGPYFSDRYQTQWGSPAVNFDGPGSDEVRRFVIDNALMWLRDYHCDGLRLDAVHDIVDQSATHILEALAIEVNALAAHLHRPLFLIAESNLNDPRLVHSRDADGYGIDAAWADEWHYALHATLSGEATVNYEGYGPLPVLAKALRQAWVYDGTYSPNRQRVHGRPPTGLSGSQFVVYTQNHDRVGNRALGERSGVLMNDGRLRVAVALLLTSPFVPMIFQGEEWGATTPFQYFTDHENPDLARRISEGRRRELSTPGQDPDDVPDPRDPAVFERSKLDWNQPGKDHHAGLLAWHHRLIALRRQIPALTDPRLDRIKTEYDQQARWLIVRRGPVAVAANLGTRTWTFAVGPSAALLEASDPNIKQTRKGLVLPPDTVAILTGADRHDTCLDIHDPYEHARPHRPGTGSRTSRSARHAAHRVRLPGRGPATPHRSPRPAPLTYGRALADADNWYAASRLADLLFERGDFDGLGARIGVGDDAAFSRLTALLIMHGQGEEAERLRRFGLNPDGSVACA